MAYIDQRTGGNQRIAAMTVVALIQGAAIIALINGLAVKWIKTEPIPNPRSTDVPITMPVEKLPPPPKPPVAKPDERPDVVEPVVTLPTTGGTNIVFPINPPTGPIGEIPIINEPGPLPTPPALTPHAAKPRNAPGSWATTSDYPSRDLRENNQGRVGFMLTIGTDGKVLSCQVSSTSGYPGLDKATCDNVARRARFEPATDEKGSFVQGRYSGAITWQIPRD